MSDSDHVYRRPENGLYEYRRRVPKTLLHLDGRKIIKRSLATGDEKTARAMAREIDAANEELWRSLLQGAEATSSWGKYEAAVKTAQLHGFRYRPIGNFREADLEEMVRRVIAAHGVIGSPQAVAAIMGTVPEPSPRLSELWGLYETHNEAGFEGMSPNQLRKHKAPRLRAIDYAIAHMNDVELREITREDVLGFRSWWVEKMKAEHLKADTINRCFSDIKGMLTVVDRALQTNFHEVWERVRVEPTNKTRGSKRGVYEPDFIQNKVLAPGALEGLNFEAAMSVYLIIETGARPSEICNLRGPDFHLKAEIPYIDIAERDDRRRKTEYSVRTIPLVGCALWAARELIAAQPSGFKQYADKEDSLSATVNKFLKARGLRPTPSHVLYSFRHSFQDRILAAGAPDRLQADIMGHEFDRPVYGEGASLKQKQELLQSIAFEWTA